MPTSVLRRYTPPTCTLEIVATGSALSRWTDRTVLKNLRFQLSFDDPKLPPEQQVTITGDRTQLEALHGAVESYVQALLAQNDVPLAPVAPTALHDPDGAALSTADISLQSQGLLAHYLHLGALAATESDPTVRLTALQLFDLANALDAYHAEALSLPTLGRSGWLTSPPGWAKVAAGLILAVGVSVPLVRFVMDVSRPTAQTASSIQVNSGASQQSQIASVPSAPASPPPLAVQPIPSPPPIGVTQPGTIQVPSAVSVPPATASKAATQPTSPPPPERVAVIPPPITYTSQLPAGTTTTIRPEGSAPERLRSTESSPGAAADQSTGGAAEATAMAPGSSATLAAPNGAGAAQGANAEPAAGASRTRVAAANTSAFDTIPQVAEVRNYFRQRWQPPQGLTQTLEYRLLLNPDGSVDRIMPLGEAAATYLDRTNMPLRGEPFVSPISGGKTPQIRLVLAPDGAVQTFLEYAN